MASTPADSVLDAIALVEARVRGGDEALAAILDAGSNRAQASVVADLAAQFLVAHTPDPLAALAGVRQAVIVGGSPPA